MLHGHERAITQIKYNREGDLLFSAAKDSQPNVWYSLNGERLGSFKGHNGAVWCIDVNWDTTKFLSGAADNFLKLWDTQTGKCISDISTNTAVRACQFSYTGKQVMFTTDQTMGHPCEIHIYDVNSFSEPVCVMQVHGPKVTSALWGPQDKTIITGHENGDLCHWDVKSGENTFVIDKEHSKQINDIQMSTDQSMIITASKDNTAKLFDSRTLDKLKTFKTDRPVNSAAMSPIKPHVVLGGGQEAMDVTTTNTRIGKFDARFYSITLEEEFGRVKGHFGPINSCAFHPDGKGYSSGGEDGYVRVHNRFDTSYFQFEFEY